VEDDVADVEVLFPELDDLLPQPVATVSTASARQAAPTLDTVRVSLRSFERRLLPFIEPPGSVLWDATKRRRQSRGARRGASAGLVTTTVANSAIELRDLAGNSPALTITPLAGGAHAAAASLVIQRLS
jgi:hypothetical protein